MSVGYFNVTTLVILRGEMKLGVEFVPYSRIERLRGLAERAERFGFDQIWVSDHYHNRYVHSVLVHLAAVTKKIMLGPGVTNPYLSHPSVIAAAVATLDEMHSREPHQPALRRVRACVASSPPHKLGSPQEV